MSLIVKPLAEYGTHGVPAGQVEKMDTAGTPVTPFTVVPVRLLPLSKWKLRYSMPQISLPLVTSGAHSTPPPHTEPVFVCDIFTGACCEVGTPATPQVGTPAGQLRSALYSV